MDNYKIIEQKEKRRELLMNIALYFFLVLWAIVVLFPFYWMVLTSLKSYGAYNAEYIPQFYTLNPTLENYVTAFTSVNLAKYFLNTIIFTLATTGIMMIVTILCLNIRQFPKS